MTAPDPCPRCRGVCKAVRGSVPDKWGVKCLECDLWADDREPTEAEAIAAWSRRALPATDARADALREAIMRLRSAPLPENPEPGMWLGHHRAIALLEAMIDTPAPDARADALREAALTVAQAAQVLLDAMTARPPLAEPFDACDVEVERLAIEYSSQGGDAVIVLETAEKFMLAGLRALIGEAKP